jgi:hypothetical protein
LRDVDDVERRVFELAGELRDRHDRVHAAVGNHVRDLAVAEQEVDWHDALAGQQRSVETGNKARACRQEQADVRLARLGRQVHPEPRGHRRELGVGVPSVVVDDGHFVWLTGGVGEERFEKHSILLCAR